MKGISKKLALFVMIGAMAMFTSVAIATAHDHWKTIHGEYAMMASGTCLYSSGGFNADNTPIGTSWPGSSMATGIWTFYRDKTGMVEGTSYGLTLPPNPSPSATTANFSFKFKYNVADDDTITVDMDGPYTGIFVTGPAVGVTTTTEGMHLFGNVSVDHKTITLASGDQPLKYTAFKNGVQVGVSYNICNIGRVLIRLDE